MKPGNLEKQLRCQIRRQTRDEDSIHAHVESLGLCDFLCFVLKIKKGINYGKKTVYFRMCYQRPSRQGG